MSSFECSGVRIFGVSVPGFIILGKSLARAHVQGITGMGLRIRLRLVVSY